MSPVLFRFFIERLDRGIDETEEENRQSYYYVGAILFGARVQALYTVRCIRMFCSCMFYVLFQLSVLSLEEFE